MEERENVDYAELFDEKHDAEETDGSATEEKTEERAEQPPEERTKYAAARRRAERERDVMLAREREHHVHQMDELIAGLGIVDPQTGDPVETKAAYDAYLASRSLRGGEDEGKKVQEAVPEDFQRRLARAIQARSEIERDMAEISRLEGAPQTLTALHVSPNWPEIDARLRRGYSLLDAYRLVNMDSMNERRTAAARQRAINAMMQKQHMQRTEQRGSGAMAVPADVKAAYRAINPGASDGEIARHYARYKQK